MANDCTNNDDVFVPETVVNPPGSGNPDGGTVVPDIMDTNVNYVVDAEDPYQNGTSTTPLETWEIGDAPVVKNYSFFPRDTEVAFNGDKQFRTGYHWDRSKAKWHKYENEGTATYNKYGEDQLPSTLPMYQDLLEQTFNGIDFKYSMSQLLTCPMVDGYLMAIDDARWGTEEDENPYASQPQRRDRYYFTFWNKDTFVIEHMITVYAPYEEHVIGRHPDYPGRSRNQGVFPETGTNLTPYLSQTFNVNRWDTALRYGQDLTTFFTGEKPEVAAKLEERPSNRSFIKIQEYDVDQMDWHRKRSRSYNETSRIFSGFVTMWNYADFGRGKLPELASLGTRQRIRPGWNGASTQFGYAPFSVKIPTPVTSVTELEMDVMAWDTLEYTKHLYNNQNAPAKGMSMCAMADAQDPQGTDYRKYFDETGTKTGVLSLGQGPSFYLRRAPELSDSGLKMVVTAQIAFMKHYRGRIPLGVHEFHRTTVNDPWVYQGASVDKVYFDPDRFGDWEAAEWNTLLGGQARCHLEPFYSGETLNVVSHNFYGHYWSQSGNIPELPMGTFKMWTPDFANTSFKRSEGPVHLSETIVTVPNLRSTEVHNVGKWTPTDVRFRVGMTSGYTNGDYFVKRELKINFVAGTYEFLDEAPLHDPKFPPRLAHLKDMEMWQGQFMQRRDVRRPWYGQFYWDIDIGDDREYVEYNGFKIFGVRETPFVPNLAYGQWARWWQGNSTIGPTYVGPLFTREHRRGMLGIGELVALDSNGNEVWRAEPHDSRAWAATDPEFRTHGRRMLFGAYPSQSDATLNSGLPDTYVPYRDAEHDEKWGATYDEDGNRDGYNGIPAVGHSRVNFGTRLRLLDGNRLFISHDSLPLGIDVPEGSLKDTVLDNPRVYTFTGPQMQPDPFYATPRDATKLHHSGYIELDLSTIPELNP